MNVKVKVKVKSKCFKKERARTIEKCVEVNGGKALVGVRCVGLITGFSC